MERSTGIAVAAGLMVTVVWCGIDFWRLGRLTSQVEAIEAELAPHGDLVAKFNELDATGAEIEQRTALEEELAVRRFDYSTIGAVAREVSRSAQLVAVTASGSDLELAVERLSDQEAAALEGIVGALWLGGNGTVTVRNQSTASESQP